MLVKADGVNTPERNVAGGCRKFDELASFALRQFTEHVIAGVYCVGLCELRRESRGRARVALARQISMYLCHVIFGISMQDVGSIFDRDRTTVAHACEVVEDHRDDRQFDIMLEFIGFALLIFLREYDRGLYGNS